MTEKLAVEVDVKNPDRGAGVVHLIYFVRIVGSLRLIAISHIVKSNCHTQQAGLGVAL